ncbi:MAG TPA: DUF2796 domain-containing protein [Dokdonella sp.]|nr:DUF2796 domain-containing protein [Dokdonella sp.]
MLRCVLLALVVALGSDALAGEPHRHHGPHVHGEATLRIGLDGQLFVVGLEAPGASVLGFEHPPRDETERARYERAADVLRHPDRWLSLPEQAGCILDGHEVTSHGFGETPAPASGGAHEHADFDGSYQYRCRAPLALRSFEVRLFEQFADLHKINVELVLPDRQGSQVLLPGATTVPLSK